MNKSIFTILALGVMMTGCHNAEKDFPDYDYQTIYFARQTPVRTITLGDERFTDNNLDNEHAFMVKAVLGGVNKNRKDRTAKFIIDNTLCDGIAFSDGSELKALPSDYYSISTDGLVIKKGEVLGGFRVDLKDAFFADPASVNTTYVLPVRLVSSSELLISGTPKDGVENPNRLNSDDWSVLPLDYVLYAVKYKNPYDGCWLSKGKDHITVNGEDKNNDRMAQYWEKASLRYLKSKSLTESVYTFEHDVPTVDAEGNKSEKHLVCDLIVSIDSNGAATVRTESAGCTASGSGQWTKLGEKNAYAGEDRDQLKLNYAYSIEYVVNEQTGETARYTAEIDETMCLRDRQNKLEEFSFILK